MRALLLLSLAVGCGAFSPSIHVTPSLAPATALLWHRGAHRSPPAKSRASSLRRHLFEPSSLSDGVSAWSVTSVTPDLAANLFQASLLPYLTFLWFLKQETTKTPKGGFFGFAFLLVFVFATIPAGIYAKIAYNDILANVDFLHGPAEFLLTLTNLFIVSAFRKAVEQPNDDSDGSSGGGGKAGSGEEPVIPTAAAAQGLNSGAVLRSGGAATAAAVVLAAAPLLLLGGLHAEPANALSFPTWMVHVSSLVEWLAAMTFIWRYADVSGVPQWKGLTWGMLPLHTSGLCACTYHIFYNSPDLSLLVPLQAALTCFGNATMAYATWRIFNANASRGSGAPADSAGSAKRQEPQSSDVEFYGWLLGITLLGSALVKWGELAVDFPFEPSYAAAAALILGPTALNVAKWAERSRDPSAPVDGIL